MTWAPEIEDAQNTETTELTGTESNATLKTNSTSETQTITITSNATIEESNQGENNLDYCYTVTN